MPELKRGAALRRELCAAERIPYSAHVAPASFARHSATIFRHFVWEAPSFESGDDAELNNWHERLNVLWRNIASPNVALWTHVIRRRTRVSVRRACPCRAIADRDRLCVTAATHATDTDSRMRR